MFAIVIRAFRTFVETLTALLLVDQFMGDRSDIMKTILVALVAATLSLILGFVTGVPEDKTDGELLLDTNIEDSSVIAGLSLDKSITPEYIDDLTTRGTIHLRIRRN